jgi:hypothetical protein
MLAQPRRARRNALERRIGSGVSGPCANAEFTRRWASRVEQKPNPKERREMTDGTVRRTLFFKFRMPAADPKSLASIMKASAPFYEFFGGTRMRLLQNADDPGQFIQEIEYETPEAMEVNRQRIASDPRLQGYLQAWRAFLPGVVEIDVYQDIAS